MTKENLLKSLESFEQNEIPSVEIFILDQPLKYESGMIFCNVYGGRMHKDMPRQILETFYPKIKRVLINKDYILQNYNPSLLPDRDVIWQYPSSEVPFYNFIIDQIDENEDNYYDDETLSYENIWAIWIKIRIRKKNIYILKKITPSKVITSGGSLAWVFSGNAFRRLEDDVLTLDGTFDVLSCENTLIFENKQKFETVLLYDIILQESASETLEEIKKINLVENFEELKDMLGDDKHSIRKLNKLKQKKYFSEKTFNDYYKIIKDYNVGVKVNIKNKKFIVLNKAQAKLLVKVLNDDYLKSELTDIKYAANSKETL
ncbi:MAG: DUF4868 domain-containing protein [bacterium]|nr:DUF4868 domain-containing protein [bacterium]